MRKRIKTQNGFTLLEIIAILVILGILSAVVAVRSNSFDAEVYTGAEMLKTHLRYAQTQAMNRNPNANEDSETFMGIYYDSGTNQYWMFRGVNPNNVELLPDDLQYTTAERKISLTEKKIRFGATFIICFNSRGIPYRTPVEKLAAPMTIVVTGGNSSKTVSITPETGFIP